MNDTPTKNTQKVHDPARLVVILFSIEITIGALLAVTSSSLNDMGLGGIIFVLPLVAAYVAMISLIGTVPAFAIIALRNKQTRSRMKQGVVWIALVCNTLVILAILTAIILEIPSIIDVYSR